MTKKRVLLYFILSLVVGTVITMLLPLGFADFLIRLFGEPTVISRIIVFVLGIILVGIILNSILQYYTRLEK